MTIPGIERLVVQSVRSALFLSTKATEQSGVLADLTFKYGYQGTLTITSCSGLADIIEHEQEYPLSREEKKKIITDYVGDVSGYDSIVLACTHYGLRYEEFCELYPEQIIIDPSQECALKLQEYLTRHPEIEQKLSR